MIPDMDTLILAILILLLPIFMIAGGAFFYIAFRLGLVHGGVVARASGSQLALTGALAGSGGFKSENEKEGISTLAKQGSPHFPSFGELVNETKPR